MKVTADDAAELKARWGRQLQAKREAGGETQVQLAARVDLFPNTISRIERGQGSLDAFLAIARALEVNLTAEAS